MAVGDRNVATPSADVVEQFNALRTSIQALRTVFIATLVKLDADAVGRTGDSDHEALGTPAADASLPLVIGEGIPGLNSSGAPVIPATIGDSPL